jgi:ABC-2 type transport system permease protein
MRPYLAVLSARFRMMLQYRAAAIAGLWTQIFFGLVMIMSYEAFYGSSTRPQPFALSQVVSYVWLGQALLAMLPWTIDAEMRNLIRSGAVVYELSRPCDLYGLWFARALAWRTAPTVLRAVPMTLLAMIVFPLIGLGEWRLRPPAPGALLPFAASLACTALLSSALTALINITPMWTIVSDGAVIFATASVSLFSGIIIPLPLFPDWAQPVLHALPFAGLADLPYRIYIGMLAPRDALPVIGLQLFWTAVLVLVGRWLLNLGLRRVVIHGG